MIIKDYDYLSDQHNDDLQIKLKGQDTSLPMCAQKVCSGDELNIIDKTILLLVIMLFFQAVWQHCEQNRPDMFVV